METIQPSNLLERFNRWIQESVMIKLFSIGFMILVLLIPSAWIQELIRERQERQQEVIGEVSEKWSGPQTLTGPVLVIPYRKLEVIDKGRDGKETREYVEHAYFLPDELDITGTVTPEVLQRGLFDAVVYSSSLTVAAVFNTPDFRKLSVPEDMVQWEEAYFATGISDLRGISESPDFRLGESGLSSEPSHHTGITASGTDGSRAAAQVKGIITKPGWTDAKDFSGVATIRLHLKGSKSLHFAPLGRTTDVRIDGPWSDPSFDGEFLPAAREVTAKAFTASWNILHFNRPFTQQWTGFEQDLGAADFGLNLLIPVDQYQKSMRTAKYGALIILFTFMALFLVEIIQHIRIHPFQYILIGAALTIYYTLLISLAEHLGYNLAYVLSAAATVTLIALYAGTFLPSPKLVLLLSGLLIAFYTFIYVIILEQDYSLVLGSIGLFLIVAALMYFSRNVRWYKDPSPAQ